MKLAIVVLLLAATACHAQEGSRSILRDKVQALKDLVNFKPMTFLWDSGVSITGAAITRMLAALNAVKDILKNTALTFTAALYPFMAWSPADQSLLFGIFGAQRSRQFANTTWNYTYVDFVKNGTVTPAKNQGKCGSCYAFGAVAAVEAQLRLSGIGNDILSEQQIVDCTYRRYSNDRGPLNLGCTSGTSIHSLQYMNESQVLLGSKYVYTERHGDCKSDAVRSGPELKYAEVEVDNEDHLAFLLNKNGPLVVYIIVRGSFSYYSKGIYNDRRCSGAVNHAVLLSGIGKDESGQEYWIIKNSWGPKWGDNGFMKMAKGVNMCELITNKVIIASYNDIITR